MALHESGENYLETIYILQKNGAEVRSVDLARELQFSKPSVSRAVHTLEDQGYLHIQADGNLQLSPQGLEVARMIYERHLFLSQYFEAIGVPETQAVADACRIEHVISRETFAQMKAHFSYCIRECQANNDRAFIHFHQKQKTTAAPAGED